MPEESKEADPLANAEATEDLKTEMVATVEDDGSEDEAPEVTEASPETTATGGGKKKKKKLSKLKDKLKKDPDASKNEALDLILERNPALRSRFPNMSAEQAREMLQKIDVAELLTGLDVSGRNQKDMASHKFWQTQPVPRFDEDAKKFEDGPIKVIDPEQVPKEPSPMAEGYEWVTMDLQDEHQIKELYELLSGHYVEDEGAMFRFNYSADFLNWALKPPGWRKEWHVGVRATKSQKLVAFISGIPTELRVRQKKLAVTEINFLCIHKKLRSKRLAPVLIKEITRRCYMLGIYQAIYTGGVLLPKPVASCRYFHRALNWPKLHDVGFSPLPSGMTKARMVTRNHLPAETSTPGLRPMTLEDVDGVHALLSRYLTRFELAQEMTKEEIEHWFVQKEIPGAEQVVWAYVVEDSETKKITDFVSFYVLESSVINNAKHDTIRAAYLYYYASQTAVVEKERGFKDRITVLVNDALILAKKYEFDVFNALTLHDNPMFLEQLKFGPGDGQLHYYLYNYRAAPIAGGVDDNNRADEKKRGGVGIVLL